MYDIVINIRSNLLIFSSSFAASGLGPLHMLRPFFLRLRDPVELDRLRERFFEVMKSRFPEDHSLKVKVTSWHGGITPDVRVKFRVGLSTNLFGSDDLLSLRMRLSLVDVCWVFCFFSFAGWCLLTLFFLSFSFF
jgi:hypothetical protein